MPTASPPDSSPLDLDPREARDQASLDDAVNRGTPMVLKVLAGVGVGTALVLSTVALVIASTSDKTTTVTMPAAMVPPAAMQGAAPARTISLSVTGGNKKGPDGKLHDSFSKTDFAVKVGQPTRLRITNHDDAPHSITAPGTGVSITVLPGVHTYTMVATNAGRFTWHCVLPCDGGPMGWAMSHPGYMAGTITAT